MPHRPWKEGGSEGSHKIPYSDAPSSPSSNSDEEGKEKNGGFSCFSPLPTHMKKGPRLGRTGGYKYKIYKNRRP